MRYMLLFLLALALFFVVAAGCQYQQQDRCLSDADCPSGWKCVQGKCASVLPGTGTFSLLVSDEQTQIGDFDSLVVTITKARIFRARAGSNETNETGFTDMNLDVTLDLTQLTGENAIEILELGLEEGTYTTIELYATIVEATANGKNVEVDIPSGKLRLIKTFTIVEDETTTFVFDIEVTRTELTNYNLRPVIGRSGTVDEDIDRGNLTIVRCTRNEDCEAGVQCIRGTCGELPNQSTACDSDADCDEGFYCHEAGNCRPVIVGCTSDADCAENQFCQFPTGTCGQTGVTVTGACVEVPSICPSPAYRPECGCDGVTYSYDCFRHKARAQLNHSGACNTGY